MGSSCGFAAFSLPIGIHAYLMTRALDTLSKACGRLPTGSCSVVGCGTITNAICKVHKTLMTNPIVGQYVLYIVQMAYAAHVTICRGLPNVKVPHTYLWMISRIIVGLPTPLLMYYLVTFYVYQG